MWVWGLADKQYPSNPISGWQRARNPASQNRRLDRGSLGALGHRVECGVHHTIHLQWRLDWLATSLSDSPISSWVTSSLTVTVIKKAVAPLRGDTSFSMRLCTAYLISVVNHPCSIPRSLQMGLRPSLSMPMDPFHSIHHASCILRTNVLLRSSHVLRVRSLFLSTSILLIHCFWGQSPWASTQWAPLSFTTTERFIVDKLYVHHCIFNCALAWHLYDETTNRAALWCKAGFVWHEWTQSCWPVHPTRKHQCEHMCHGHTRFPMQVLIIRYDKRTKDHVTLGGSYCKKNGAHVCSDWIEHHGRAWKDRGNTNSVVVISDDSRMSHQ